MKLVITIALISCMFTLISCTADKAPTALQQLPAVSLSPADKEKLVVFQNDLLNIETITDKAIKIAVDELKNVIKGGTIPTDMTSVIERAKTECLLAGETLLKKSVPETLPPEMKKLLNEGQAGLVSSYKAYAESFDAIKSFINDKNPMALLDYQKKSALAKELYTNAANKFSVIMTAAGVTK